jgi:predicted GNAT family acetyltransferase
MANENRKSGVKSKFEYEEDGATAYLEVEIDSDGWITLWHTEVPPSLRGRGVAGMLVKTAFEYARDNHLKVDVICPIAVDFLSKNPEFKNLVGK